MKTVTLPSPGVVFGSYPERRTSESAGSARRGLRLTKLSTGSASKRFARDVDFAMRRREQIANLSKSDLERALHSLRTEMSRDGLADHLIVEAFALISHVSDLSLRMAPFDTQLLAARIMLDNRLAEMATGEGKTLAAGVCAATAALAGIPVHVMTSNDYLVTRDAKKLRPLYRALGLKVDFVTQQMQADRRRCAYDADITYCTAKELAFDYLRDTMIRRGKRSDLHLRIARLGTPSPNSRDTVMRGLCMAIVDEADSILIDEARVPLILSRQVNGGDYSDHYAQALHIAGTLIESRHFRLDPNRMAATLTNAGRERVECLSSSLSSIWRNRLRREELVCQSLAALYLYQRDRHYLVERGTVTIIDEMTGRVAPGRVWSRGLHQLIESKEGCLPTDEQVTSAQITFQRFFQKYLCLGGMSGTIREARQELSKVYGLDVMKVHLRRPDCRQLLPTIVYADRPSQYLAVVDEVKKRQQTGQPVLIGTDSVGESEQVAALLKTQSIAPTLLNARQDKAEADIVSKAGSVGSVTVATNMAGRGTDIPLGPGAAELGGLHVISCQHNASRRIDRQLIGRCARQGDPGSAQALLCLEQPLLQRTIPAWLSRLVSRSNGLSKPQWLVHLIAHVPQMLEERRQRAQRYDMLEQDLKLDEKLASIDGFE